MNRKIAGAAVFVAIFGFGEVAHADLYKLTPANSSFSASGQGSVRGSGGSYSCNVSLTGTTGKTTGSITGVTFSGAAGCENVMPAGLPWEFRPTSTRKIQIRHFNLTYGGLGRCGPGQVTAGLSQGTISFTQQLPSKAGMCKLDASLVTSPALAITK